ncbi:PASTA domain-containing protein [Candidatus Sumerlaeota bacterium]|nr:PASTA domain-containing protein [Candidatus Sumerlaeota bacterium]
MNTPDSQDLAASHRGAREKGRPRTPRRRSAGADLLLRFLFFVFQVLKIGVLSAVVFALAGVAAYSIVEDRIRGKEVVVPSLAGMRVEKALEEIHEPDLDLGIKLEKLEYSDLASEGEIVSQNPPPGKRVKRGAEIRVRVSRGPTLVVCPDVKAVNYLEAGIRIREADLVEGPRSMLPDAGVERDGVIAQDPPAGTLLERRSPVSLLVSLGPAQSVVLMPSLADLTKEEADKVLDGLGLTIQSVAEEPLEGRDNGLIFRQDPPAGSLVSAGRKISVTVVNNLGQEIPWP